MQIVSRLQVKYKLMLLIIIFLLSFAGFGFFAYNQLDYIKVNGPVYARIVQGKDVIADILPPPEYIIESYLNAFQMLDGLETGMDAEKLAGLKAKANSLEQDYVTRHIFWVNNLPEGEQRDLLLKESYIPAAEFYRIRNDEFIPAIEAGDQEAAIKILREKLDPLYQQHRTAVDKVVAMTNDLNEQEEIKAAESVKQTNLGYFLLGGISLLFCVGVAFAIANPITTSLRQMAVAADNIALGQIEQNITFKTRDEIGQLANAFRSMTAYFKEMVEAAREIASGNFRVAVNPRSEKDLLGLAFQNMAVNLSSLVGQVSEDAGMVSEAAGYLGTAANEAEEAVRQISITVKEVSDRITQQVEEISKVVNLFEQINRTIDGVAAGSQEQSRAISQVSEKINALMLIIQQVTNKSIDQAERSGKAVSASKNSLQRVADTTHEMQSIQSRVVYSSRKIEEMGKRSDEIGTIVETIEEIASQTNLLALNAAIEAARAGEHGKGFAVVSDEVRKLAEKSVLAAKNIAMLVENIQLIVNDTIKAINESADEVKKGVHLAEESYSSIESILDTAENNRKNGEEIAGASKRMNALAEELVSVMDTVSAVVEENNAAAEEMSAGSSEALLAIEAIASGSEENSQAMENISDSVNGVTGQMEEISAASSTLADMSQELNRLTAGFKLQNQVNILNK
ncbi:MAG: methyl-accepting chemotaxis protein [Anaerolineae bacterium]|nr:methyl-accepting chemotaxis protein [Anaerolineae bacterium]